MTYKLLKNDPQLTPFAGDIALRMENYKRKKASLLAPGQSLSDFANGHLYYGLHRTDDGWVYREWAPGAEEMYLTGDFCHWERRAYPMERLENGVFQLQLPDILTPGSRILAIVVHNGQELERIPLYAHRVEQDPENHSWNAVVCQDTPFPWTDSLFRPKKRLLIYECHIGMAQEEGKVGSYEEFRLNILPRIRDLGYNAIQIMAIMEHPYYASFGYQVTNFFAASSRFGTQEQLKKLIDTAHEMGIAVLLDVVHSHACINTREGINEFDGTLCQFFHEGPRGNHSAWGTKCFNYGKNEVIHFLLSNLKYWLENYHFDGFRFDGVTSMLYHDHGLGTGFDSPEKYFSMNTDTEAVTYLQLATELCRQVCPHAILIAEDMSAMPGMCLPIKDGGIGFDYRLAMGQPDLWVRLLEDVPDENWDLGHIFYELTIRRPGEKVIGYCESHDQALVGDKTIMFRLCDQEMYWSMEKTSSNLVIDRGMALHKMLRLLTLSLGGDGYLTFMGNEFGHPEWIDFPREGNGWSYHYCRRQWSLADNPKLRYGQLLAFEKAMVAAAKRYRCLIGEAQCLFLDNREKILVYQKGAALFAFNFHPARSAVRFFVKAPEPGQYRVVLSTDDALYGGQQRIWHQTYEAAPNEQGETGFYMYLPSRTAAMLRKG